MPDPTTLPSLADQAERLIALGVAERAGIPPAVLRDTATRARHGLLVLDPALAPASQLAPLLEHRGKAGFVVEDLTDVDEFAATADAPVPAGALYVVSGLDRGDHLAGWSPDEALPEIIRSGRTPLTLAEGIHWVIQQPAALERGRCFMTVGSRLVRSTGRLDARTPAIWLSNGTGRDGRARRDAPKVGWCWAGNRHTWLGFASATGRHPLRPAPAGPSG